MPLPKGDILTLFIRTLFYHISSCSLERRAFRDYETLEELFTIPFNPGAACFPNTLKGKELLDTPFFLSQSARKAQKQIKRVQGAFSHQTQRVAAFIRAG
jgi:hypothetical protein